MKDKLNMNSEDYNNYFFTFTKIFCLQICINYSVTKKFVNQDWKNSIEKLNFKTIDRNWLVKKPK